MKPTILIDLRPIQSGQTNGVTISSINWITDIIDTSQSRANIILWTNGHSKPKFPKKWLSYKHVKHKHTGIPNKLLNLILSYTSFIKIDKLLKTEIYSYFCPDLRPFNISKSCKSYMYIHDVAFIKFKKFYSLKSRLWYKLINPKNTYQKADCILTNSEFSKQEIQTQFGIKKIEVIHPHLEKNYQIKNNNRPIKQPYFVIVSTLQPRKNLLKAIEAFKKYNQENNHKLVIIGTTEKTFKKFRQPKNSNIHFLGFVKESLKKKFIQHAVGLIHIPLYEGFSMPILESLTLGTPVLASNIPVHSEIYKEQIIYCVSSDSDQISDQITKLSQQKSVEFAQLVDSSKLLNLLLT